MITPLSSQPEPKRGRGRPRKLPVDPRQLDVLTIPEALAYCRSCGRSLGRPKLLDAIIRKAIPAQTDDLHNDRFGRPLMMICRADLDRWLVSTLRPFNPPQLMGVVSI